MKQKKSFSALKYKFKNFYLKNIHYNSGKSFDMSILFILLAFFFCIALSFPFSQVWITNSNLNSMSKLVVEQVEFRGKVDSETYSFIRTKLKDFNLEDKNPTYRFTGHIRGDGKIQLQDEFTFHIEVTDKLNFASLIGNGFSINVPISKNIVGYSENFYRDSEL